MTCSKQLLLAVTILVISIATLPQSVHALATGYTAQTFVSGLGSSTQMAFAPDGRLFISEKSGRVRVVKNGTLLPTPFLQLTVDDTGERGLQGLAFDPDYNTNRYLYVFYTTPGPKTRVSRFQANSSNPDIAITSETILLEFADDSPGSSNHNGGSLLFGSDGYIYVSVGDGGTNRSNAQTTANFHGKILRINKTDGSAAPGNPTINGTTSRIYALGLRNPYTMEKDPVSGKIYINDVGENTWEEIDQLQPGANYGWPTCEGSCATAGFTNPLYQYNHSVGVAIIGGGFWNAGYFFSDYGYGWLKRLNSNGSITDIGSQNEFPSTTDMEVGPDNRLYVLSAQGFVKVVSSSTGPSNTPTPTATPTVNAPPVVTITNPQTGALYTAGNTIAYAATATDVEDGVLAASRFSWRIVFHHDTHTHPFLDNITGVKSGSFVVPEEGEVSSNVFYRIYVRVTDSAGQSTEVYRDIRPQTVDLTLQTDPAGLGLLLDDQPFTAPRTVSAVVNFIRSIGIGQNPNYRFLYWSDNGTPIHTIRVPSTNITYTAYFQKYGDADRNQVITVQDAILFLRNYSPGPITSLYLDQNTDTAINLLDFAWTRK